MTTTSPQVKDLPQLDRLLTDPARLLIAAALVRPASRRVEEVADAVGLEKADLLRRLGRLREEGYVHLRRDEHQHSWVRITEEGQARLLAHLKSLRALLEKVDALVVRT
ncbi:transcriptional regulator [Amycolatopsis alkalitolerans]|uniref:Transcriptional regulator n=1 Tax=Amycolatopsis alkalitolerans TaxID=2547244 RepID=A0A5C4M130_9PSEU|nr:transcriptional regulator [Amycolatopsis alkalitolerans]TNC26411.1 transcriptional regulator [Amycolatopsis alkalitolerans]